MMSCPLFQVLDISTYGGILFGRFLIFSGFRLRVSFISIFLYSLSSELITFRNNRIYSYISMRFILYFHYRLFFNVRSILRSVFYLCTYS